MPKGDYHSVTLKPEIYSALKQLSRNTSKSMAETIGSLVTGTTIIHGVRFADLFTEEQICLNCGCRPGSKVGKCPGCGSADSVITRYVKSSRKGIESYV